MKKQEKGEIELPVRQAYWHSVAMSNENLVRKAILEGVDPQQAYLQYGRF